jgi:hypothetical protein
MLESGHDWSGLGGYMTITIAFARAFGGLFLLRRLAGGTLLVGYNTL